MTQLEPLPLLRIGATLFVSLCQSVASGGMARGAQERSESENEVTALELAGPDEDAEIGGPVAVDVAGQDALGKAQLTGGCEWLGSDERKALRARARRINISFRTIDPIAVSSGKI